MLIDFNIENFSSPYENDKKKDLQDELFNLQRVCISKDIPVIIMIEGWESSGKGYVLNELVRELDTKHTDVHIFDDFSKTKNKTYTRQFWEALPAKGDFALFDKSMYYHMFNDLDADEKIDDLRVEKVKNLEKLLSDDNTIIIKFFLHISKETQSENIQILLEDEYKDFFISQADIFQNENYEQHLEHFNEMMNKTNFSFSPWQIVPSYDRKLATNHILGKTIEIIEEAILKFNEKREELFTYKAEEITPKTSIKDFDLSVRISDQDYDKQLDLLQEKAGNLAYKLYTMSIPTLIVFEGIDAAGKGGTIKRLVRNMDARGYDVNPTSAPSGQEKDHHYLWRFYNNFPDSGNMVIFDRSWYGRVLVERIEGFANEYEWSRAYDEINKMEKELVDSNSLFLKYLLLISKDEQAKRFRDREVNKSYKITDEDWRNRSKWDQYIEAMDDMIEKTSTDHAPWKIVSSQQKKFARIEVLKDFIKNAEDIIERNQ